MHDPLDLLSSPPGPPADVILRRRLLDRTLGEVRRGRRCRRLRSLAALAGSFVAGFFTLAALAPPPNDAPDRPARQAVEPGGTALVAPVDLEWQALERPAESSDLYKRAGDGYLRQGEHADALRCYGNALDEAAPGELEVNGDDSWLLIAIKHARKKEMDECARE
jgi:hypothetical protein